MRTLILVLPLAACLTEEGFPEAVADEVCDRWRACDLGGLQEAFGDDDVCRAHVEASMQDVSSSAVALDCLWDDDRARACLRRISSPGCEAPIDLAAILDDCAGAWGCAD